MDKPFETLFEPFRIKATEPIAIRTRAQRQAILEQAQFNMFMIKAEDITIDLLTDSGTGAMSAAQWAGLMNGDESYAGCRSFYRFESVVQELTGYAHIFPTHQGRAAERILFSILGGETKHFLANTHFDTTRANIEFTGAHAHDLVIDEGLDPTAEHPFKGNIDIGKLEHAIEAYGVDHIPLCLLTVTNNSGGGQPVSLSNIEQTSRVCRKHGIPLFLDACRFAENAYFIKMREPAYAHSSIEEIAHKMFALTDGCTMSAKKDGLTNIGGFVALNDKRLAEMIGNMGILTEGYTTYGGLAGRDLEAIAIGLQEVIDEAYLAHRIASTNAFGHALLDAGLPIVLPVGGHAVYIDAKRLLPHIPPSSFPGQALACALYAQGGVRTVEIGSLMFGHDDDNNDAPERMELVRLALPRRVYTQSHLVYVVEVAQRVAQQAKQLRGMKIVKAPKFLRHFSAHLAPL